MQKPTDSNEQRPMPKETAPDYAGVKSLICENIEYDRLLEYVNKSDLDSYVQLLTKTICHTKTAIKIGGQHIDIKTVRNQLMKLNATHIIAVMNRVLKRKGLRNAEAYTLKSLYKESLDTENTALPATLPTCSRREPSFDIDEYEEFVRDFTPVYQRHSA